ncbi:MAG TPA: isoleucine--tRNA ligase [Hyphomicrobiaceae bacterium]|nr:isoleucine--tRNA ligase [Hyphomicrobiaceae bacterium]
MVDTKPGRAATARAGRDWSQTLFLPKTDFPMRAGLPAMEPKLLERWARIGLYERLRKAARGKPKFVLHDGPPYANANIHIGHALNKILKDFVVRSQSMLGFDSNYVPGWDCHGLPIEWKIEEEYRAKGKNKDAVPVIEFRKECREFAQAWIGVQREEFKRLGVEGDWDHYYSTMAYHAEAAIAAELMKFAMNGLLYRGSKPVMWSVVEKTALAEAEVEYRDYTSDQVWVKFPVRDYLRSPDFRHSEALSNASVLIWTTTPWTLPGNRAIAYSKKINYSLIRVKAAPAQNWAKPGDVFILAEKMAETVMKTAKVEAFETLAALSPSGEFPVVCEHPLRARGYDFPVPLLDGDHVTDEDGTGFVHTAPGHGREDFEIWTANAAALKERGIDTTIPFTVDEDGRFTKDAPGFEGRRVITEQGEKGDANEAVIKALIEAGMLIARGRLKHQYPHSWRSKKPVIFRNTPQWFIAMDKPFAAADGRPSVTLRELALRAIAETEFVPPAGQNRLRGMIENRPDWVISRQRAWGVPITVFVHKDTGEVIPSATFAGSAELIERIRRAMAKKGADAWFARGARSRFLKGLVDDPAEWEQVTDILDVWFDSGSTHAYTLEDPEHFPGLAGIRRIRDGGQDRVMYLEGSDQHRGWFQSTLLESCGTRGRAPYDIVLTHGFVLDEAGNKMSKSSKNGVSPQDAIKDSGADILRLWVAASDYANDVTLSTDIMRSFSDLYRKLRNTIRWMLGSLAYHEPANTVAFEAMPELERLMLNRLAELDCEVRTAYAAYDYNKVVTLLSHFMTSELSAFYFDIRKDTLYCEPYSSRKRWAALHTIEQIFRAVTLWLAPILVFTAEEAWLARYGEAAGSIHLEEFPAIPKAWRDAVLAAKWEQVRRVRSVVTGALEIERAAKRIGSSLEAAPAVYIADPALRSLIESVDFAEVCITSAIEISSDAPPAAAFTLPEVSGVSVLAKRASGRRCARSWRISTDVGKDPEFPDLTPRDAAAVREFDARAGGRH